MNEFKTVVERFEENQKKVIEIMHHRFDRVDADIKIVKQEIALLHEGQTAIRSDLRRKVTVDDFDQLEKRVARLEIKTAAS